MILTNNLLSFSTKDTYDAEFIKQVYAADPVQLKDLEKKASERKSQSVRITYTDKNTFKTIAKSLDIMNDYKVCMLLSGTSLIHLPGLGIAPNLLAMLLWYDQWRGTTQIAGQLPDS